MPTSNSIGLPVRIALDAQSIWAEVHGEPEVLSRVEDSLRAAIEQGLSAAVGKKGMQPWFSSPGKLHVLAGLLPWAWPEHGWPQVWNGGDAPLHTRLRDLEQWGWRQYQLDAVEAAVCAPLGRGIVEVGTGGGKTRIAWGIAYVAGGDWLYVVHGRDLVRQATEDFRSYAERLSGPQQVGWSISASGWRKAPTGRSPAPAGLLVDECHGAAARSRAQKVAAFRGGWRIGLSGTALDRSDDRNPMTVGLFGPSLAQVGVGELTEGGHLTPGVVRIVEF